MVELSEHAIRRNLSQTNCSRDLFFPPGLWWKPYRDQDDRERLTGTATALSNLASSLFSQPLVAWTSRFTPRVAKVLAVTFTVVSILWVTYGKVEKCEMNVLFSTKWSNDEFWLTNRSLQWTLSRVANNLSSKEYRLKKKKNRLCLLRSNNTRCFNTGRYPLPSFPGWRNLLLHGRE